MEEESLGEEYAIIIPSGRDLRNDGLIQLRKIWKSFKVECEEEITSCSNCSIYQTTKNEMD